MLVGRFFVGFSMTERCHDNAMKKAPLAYDWKTAGVVCGLLSCGVIPIRMLSPPMVYTVFCFIVETRALSLVSWYSQNQRAIQKLRSVIGGYNNKNSCTESIDLWTNFEKTVSLEIYSSFALNYSILCQTMLIRVTKSRLVGNQHPYCIKVTLLKGLKNACL